MSDEGQFSCLVYFYMFILSLTDDQILATFRPIFASYFLSYFLLIMIIYSL